MAGSINKVILIGNLGKDPEIRSMPDGSKIANFSIATSESWNDKNTGQRQERTEWHRISVMNDRVADIVSKYVRKGSKVYVEGQLQTRKWTDKNGAERFTTEIVIGRFRGELTLLDSKGSSGSDNSMSGFDDSQSYSGNSSSLGLGGSKNSVNLDDLDDSVPF